MTTFERIKKLSERRNKNLQDVAISLGFSKNIFYKWKTSEPKGKDLQKVAEYFDVSVDYLLGRTDDMYLSSGIKEVDIEDESTVLAFDGQPVSAEERAFLKSVIDSYRKNK